MTSYTLLSAAKINLYLEIIGHRSDGFHELAMVMQSVDLCDRITLTSQTMPGRRLQCNHPQVPTDRSNPALQAVEPPTQQMPAQANQSPWPGQSVPISTERVQSNIPKNGTDASWTYPSPQMFYNALKRKGKVMIAESSCPCELVSYGTSSRPLQDENVQETDMESVVAIHNNMNENTWCEILNWERLHSAKCDSPKLSRFFGRVSLTDFVIHKQVT